MRRDYLEHLAANADGTLRRCAAAHLTASTLVVEPAGGRVLLTLHRRVGRWLQLGGHCEPQDEGLAAAALREAIEESGVAALSLDREPVRLHRHPVRCRPDGESLHLDVQFVGVAPFGTVERISSESLALQWFDWDRLPADADDAVLRLVAASRARVLGRAAPQSTSSAPANPDAADTPCR